MPLRVALIGCGAMSRTWLEAARQIEDLEIVALADVARERAFERARESALTDAAIYDGIDELLHQTKPDLLFDVVVPSARHEIVSKALAAGCHVLSEKPMAATLAEARDLIERAKAAGRTHAIMQNRRYIAAVRRIARVVAAGAIGEITSVHADFFLGPHFGGFRDEMDHVLLVDMAIHAFDAMRCMTGLSATSAYCREWEPKGSWYRQGSSAIAIFDLTGGAIFTYRGSWAQEGIRSSWEASWRICGTKGSLIWDGNDDIRAEVAGERMGLLAETLPIEIPPLSDADVIGGHLGVIRAFVSAIRTGTTPETAGIENINSLAMVFAVVASSASGQTVHITI